MSDPESQQADALAQLIHAAGRREEPPADVYQRTLAAATATWERKVRVRRQRIVGAIAAGMAAAVVGLWFIADRPLGPVEPVAHIERIIGAADVRGAKSAEWTPLRDESRTLDAGTTLRTVEGSRVGVLLADGVSVRLADKTSVTLESASRIRLIAGKVYLDSGRSGANRVAIATEAGTAYDIGTQFEVEYLQHAYRLSVREGEVRLQRGQTRLHSRAGEQLSIDVDGHIRRAALATDDPQWQWAEGVAPVPDIENQPLTVLLDWVARETGRAITFASPEVERKAGRTILHGNIRHLAPLQALSVMLATTDLQHVSLPDGTIMIK